MIKSLFTLTYASFFSLPCKLVREQKMLTDVLHQGSLQLFHNFENTFEVVELKHDQAKTQSDL